jgi:VanZ family protein
MRDPAPLRAAAPVPLVRGITITFQVVLWVAILFLATAFGYLHRYGAMETLIVVCLLAALWVVSSLMAPPLRHLRSWANLPMWGLLAILLFQILPVPWLETSGIRERSLGAAESVLVAGPQDFYHAHSVALSAGRYSLRPAATTWMLVAVVTAAALYWLLASSLAGRKSLRHLTWAVMLGLAPPALWVILAVAAPARRAADEVFRTSGFILILGGDSYVPALLAALPLCLAAVMRLVGWMPRRRYDQRQSRWGWLGRAGPIWAGIGWVLMGLIAAALGMSNVPVWLLAACTVLAVGIPVFWYATTARLPYRARRRPIWLAAGVMVWVLLAMGLARAAGPAHYPASSADDKLRVLIGAASSGQKWLGVGGGAVTPRAIFGFAGWPAAPGDDGDTNGYLVLRAEMGWLGFGLALAAAIGLLAHLTRAWRRAASPWPRLMMLVGVGALLANLLYFRYDASALLAPNLVALAAVLGVVSAWSVHGAAWRGREHAQFGPAHWPLVIGAVGLLGGLALAESEMLAATPSQEVNDKILHFAAFGVINLLLCYAFGPSPTAHYLKTRIIAATMLAAGMGVLTEYAQGYLTANRSFEVMDMVAGAAGAVAMALWWWVMRRAHVVGLPEPLESPDA